MRFFDRCFFLRAVTLAALLIGASSAPAFGAIAHVQTSPVEHNASTSVTVTLPAASTSGNLLVATVGAAGATSISAPAGWVRAVQNNVNAADTDEIWYYPSNPGGITSVTFSSSGTSMTAGVSEWSGVAASSPLDKTGTSADANNTALTVSTSAATTTDGQLAVTSFAHKTNTAQPVTFTPGSGWTNLGSTASLSVKVHGTADYRLGLAAGTISEQQTASLSGGMLGAIATFKAEPVCTGGSLTLSAPTSVGFPSMTLDGTDQTSNATVALGVSDMSGTGSGWRVTGTSTQFTNAAGKTLPTSATTVTAASATAATGNCSLPTNAVGYPLTLPAGTTAPTAVKLFNAGAGSGEGPSDVDLTARLAVPANAYNGTYSSTWTISVVSGP